MTYTQKCSTCRKTKPVSAFGKNAANKAGRNIKCKACYNVYMRSWYEKNKHKHIERVEKVRRALRNRVRALIVKAKTSCLICGEGRKPCLDFHHNDPTEKKFRLAEAANGSRSEKQVRAEILKCSVLCANCHRLVESGEITIPAVAQG